MYLVLCVKAHGRVLNWGAYPIHLFPTVKKLKSVKKSKKSVTKLLKNKPPVPKRTSSSSSNKSRRWSQANESEKQKAKNELRRVMGH